MLCKLLISLIVLASVGWVQSSMALDVGYVPTPRPVVQKMLELADVGPDDVVYDLGSGDGRIVIMAAKKYGARGFGVDMDPHRIREARQNARKAGVAGRVRFRQGDLFKINLARATVVTMYLLPSINLRLRPKLLRELEPGSRVVSHEFSMGDWEPKETVTMPGHTVHYWVVPDEAPVFGP